MILNNRHKTGAPVGVESKSENEMIGTWNCTETDEGQTGNKIHPVKNFKIAPTPIGTIDLLFGENMSRQDQPLETNPCHLVRQSCLKYVKTDACRSHVTIREEAIPDMVNRILQQKRTSSDQVVEWDEEHWHYRCDQNATSNDNKDIPSISWPESIRKERIALYILALDAINFSFWMDEKEDNWIKYEYEDLAVTLTNMAKADHSYQQQVIHESNDGREPTLSSQYTFSPSSLEHMTVDHMTQLFQAHHAKGWVPPNIAVRCRIWNEIGRVLNRAPFHGSISSVLNLAHQSAPRLVHLLIEHFPNFRDDTIAYPDDSNRPPLPSLSQLPQLYFYKRAQICVADLNAALLAQGLPLSLSDLDQITTFADYRVPQLLRHYDILQYSPQLTGQIDDCIELAPFSNEEFAIRTATVAAVELLVLHLPQNNSEKVDFCSDGEISSDTATSFSWTAMQIDWYLWQLGERMDQVNALQPHHRVRTTFY